jgi:propanediol dehydratase small subunit
MRGTSGGGAEALMDAAEGRSENLRRAAELTGLPDEEVLGIYEALRPGRSSRAALDALAAPLESAAAPLCAALVREAAAAYERRGILPPG